MNKEPPATAARCTDQQLVGMLESLMKLGITGDSLFERIRNDLNRGLTRYARSHLNFVDVIVACGAKRKTNDE